MLLFHISSVAGTRWPKGLAYNNGGLHSTSSPMQWWLSPPTPPAGAMSNGYRARIYPRDTGIWSSPTFSVHCIVSLHCSASQISSECCLEPPAGGGGVGLGWVKASPGRLPTVRAAFPAGPDWAAVPGCPVTRPTGLLTAPRPRGGARGREMPPCLCVCALVCLRGGGGRAVAHLLAPLLFGVGAHGAGKCVPGAPGPGREAGEPDAEPAGGDVGLGSQPPRHKDMLPNHSTTAYWHGKAVVRGTTGVRPALLDCLRHRWCCLAGWVRLPRPRAYPGQMEGHQGAECASLPWVPPVLAALAAALQPA